MSCDTFLLVIVRPNQVKACHFLIKKNSLKKIFILSSFDSGFGKCLIFMCDDYKCQKWHFKTVMSSTWHVLGGHCTAKNQYIALNFINELLVYNLTTYSPLFIISKFYFCGCLFLKNGNLGIWGKSPKKSEIAIL